ncbi:MAG: dynamin family protein [Bacteroidaceae bacterium]|nr:dynamin family protein [Bacteroidaceae bacterium]
MANTRDFCTLKQLLEEGEELGLDLSALINKVSEYIRSKESDSIKIVLLGSFSDGKTTAMAGLLGKLEDNMKIDEDESSDELSIYHIESLGNNYEIVDTPGLFGTREKEVDGKNVRFSEITERYISEAHIVIYVTNSKNTLKDSHKDIIKRVLRDYNKLNSAIFVINKMDDVSDTNDEEDYAEISAIKRQTFIDRLRQTIDLTPDEEKNLKIVCIAANPNIKGLEYWFNKKEEYYRRSHIKQLQDNIESIVGCSDNDVLRENTDKAVIYELVAGIYNSISSKVAELNNVIEAFRLSLNDLETDLSILKSSIVQNKGLMTERIYDYKNSLFASIGNIGSLEEMGTFLETEIGINGTDVCLDVVLRRTNQIVSECAETNNAQINVEIAKFERVLSSQNDLLNGIIQKGLKGMRDVNGKMVLKARDIFFKGHKFKPWGAVKIAKGVGAAAAALGLLVDYWNLYKKYKDNKKLREIKVAIKDLLSQLFENVCQLFDNDNEYYKNFAPSLLEMEKMVKERRKDIEVLTENTTSLDRYKHRFKEWYGDDIEDAVFEDIGF